MVGARSENPRVGGSIPPLATTHTNPHQCKLVGVLFWGVRLGVDR